VANPFLFPGGGARGYYTGVKISHLALALLLAACSVGGSKATATVASVTQNTAAPSPEPPLLILLAPTGSDAQLVSATAEIANDFASSHGMQVQQVDRLSANELPSNLATLIVLAPDPGAADLAAAASSVRVIAVGFNPTADQPNLQTLLGSAAQRAAAFISGTIAEITAPDWRAGMLYSPASADLVESFKAGAEYFCGSCVPEGPPLVEYPQAIQATDPANWQAGADELLAQSVKVVYLAPELERSGAAEYLARFGVLLIGSGSAPQGLEANWLASVSSDPVAALRQQLSQALAGETVDAVSALAISNANPDYFGEGRLAFIQKIIDDLLNGYIELSRSP
jgi:hypothetical protein